MFLGVAKGDQYVESDDSDPNRNILAHSSLKEREND